MIESWIPLDGDGDFSIQNLPYGVFSDAADPTPRCGVRIGDFVLDLKALSSSAAVAESLSSLHSCAALFAQPYLNGFAAAGRTVHRNVRRDLQRILDAKTDLPQVLEKNEVLRQQALVPVAKVVMQLPVQIGDYTDFYAGYHHAYNVGVLFRGPENALQPNYTHLPVGYHGRSSSIMVSGGSIKRPWGQILPSPGAAPITSPSRKMDFELELGCIIGSPNALGEPVDVNRAEEHIFGYVLLNDWSARDIQAWEYVPLGPFNGKNFGSTISPWVVTTDALEPFRTEPLANETALQDYLQEAQKSVFDITLSVSIQDDDAQPTTISTTSSKNLLWSFPQMIAHHTLGGCPLQPGDMLGSGTISGTETDERGSLLEMTEGGKQDVKLTGGGGTSRSMRFLQDGDSVTLMGRCEREGLRIGFGCCHGRLLAASER
ncbi:hypothetical protein B0I35DRAFT_352458 [Stachybotrys elegans]|uniref:Fumarylacetoacetase n=1 Tax=Stachybotrys elegans TaxID=80388 RepID=A0A8K0WRM0_9HYPO|nr:hypothetical protein B0I35DRAFT_352458 [Stachybotrys elegans]